MTSSREKYQSRLKTIRAAIASAYAARSEEGKLGSFLQKEMPDFVYAGEGAPIDGGIFCPPGDTPDLPSGFDARLYDTVKKFGKKKLLLPVDFKLLNPITLPEHKGGLYVYSIKGQPGQSSCAAIVVFNPQTPDLVALVPRQLLSQAKEWQRGELFYTRELILMERPWEPFPMEWQGCVMPVEMLPEALRIMRDYALGKRATWYNPYSGVVFEACERPNLQPVSILKPDDTSLLKDFAITSKLRDAFLKHGTNYEILRPSIQPSVGDFLILHRPTGVISVVEMKQNQISHNRDGSISHVWGRPRQNKKGKKPYYERYFSGIVMWDFLMTIFSRNGKTWCYLIRKDELPKRWFTMGTKDLPKSDRLGWRPSDRKFLANHLLRLDNSRSSVVKFENLLEEYRTKSSLHQQAEYRPAGPTPDDFDAVLVDNGIDIEAEPLLPELRPDLPVRGTGRQWASKLWEGDHAFLIQRENNDGKYGRLFQIGAHPIGSWVYANVTDPNLTFSGLHPCTPIIFLNFAHINLTDQRIPDDARHPKKLKRVTLSENGVPSMYVLVPERGKGQVLELPGIFYFLAASQALATRERAEINEQQEFSVGGQDPGVHVVEFVDGKMIEPYAVPNFYILPALQSFLETGNGDATLPDGRTVHITDQAGFENMISTKAEAANQLYRMAKDLTRLGVRSRGKRN